MKLHPRLLLYLTAAFIGTTVIGTLLHEAGHFIVAELLGYEAFIHYGYTSFADPRALSKTDHFLIVVGGVASTLAIGTTGLVLLYVNRRSFASATSLTLRQWVAVFLSLFWLRQLTNGLFGLSRYLRKGTFRSRGDETVIDRYFHFPYGSTLLPTAAIALVVLAFICLKVIPRKQLPTFLVALAVGGSVGYYLWLVKFGRILMP